ncbi:MAG: sugar transferase [Parcubacteria group bacterium]|jgi:exopolysaccharide biosynthesis polyprenyl glycosylphosphotransferase
MKRSELLFSAIQVPVDFIMIFLGAISAFAIRNFPQIITLKPKLYEFSFHDYMQIVFFVAPLFILVYAIEGLYKIKVTRKYWQEIFKVFVASSLVLVIIIVAIFLQRTWFSSRFIILAGWILVVVYVSIARLIIHEIQKFLLVSKGLGAHRVLLIGENDQINEIRKIIKKMPSMGYRIVDQIGTFSLKFIKEIRERKGIDEMILCDPTITDAEQEKIIDYCAINNISYKYIPTSFQASRVAMGMLDGVPIIEVEHTPLDGWGKIIKRIFDIIGSSALIIISSPIMLVVAIFIKLQDDGPIIYKNERIGDNDKKFLVYKFRYMKWKYCITKKNPNFEEALTYEKNLIKEKSLREGPVYKIKNDPRKTAFGSFIEKYSIDEIPQFFNVFVGNMSLVGPRPHQEREVEKYKEYHRRLLTIKPGITGLAQISGRSDLDFEDEYKLDIFYIENWSLLLDIQICFKTLGVLFRRRKNNR